MQCARTLRPAGFEKPEGVTLIEILAALALLAILTSIAVPSYTHVSRAYRLDAVTEEFMASVQFARVEAMRLGQNIMLQRHTACDVVLSSTADWSCGWQVFADTNGSQTLDGTETVLQSVAVPAGITFQKGPAGSPRYLHIDRFGRTTSFGQRFEVFPRTQKVVDGQVICFSTGTRLRTVKRVEGCPPLPGEDA